MTIAPNRHHNLSIFAALAICLTSFSRGQNQPSTATRLDNDKPLIGVSAINEPLPWFDSEKRYGAYDAATRSLVPNATVAVTSLGRPAMREEIRLRLSRYRYPAEDGHLDAVLTFNMDLDAKPQGELEFVLSDNEGQTISRQSIASIPGSQIHFSYRYPSALIGKSGSLRVNWKNGDRQHGSSAKFEIADAMPKELKGRIPITIPNPDKAKMKRVPVNTGVPFPNGVLWSADNLRLTDSEGQEIALQAVATANWSRFGSLKWVNCSFEVDLDGDERQLYLEYGSDVRRTSPSPLAISPATGFPTVDAGRIRLDQDGLWFDDAGQGDFKLALGSNALRGAFIEHTGAGYAGWGHRWMSSRGAIYTIPSDTKVEIEEQGSERIVLRTEGWYRNEDTGKEFCQYLVRYILHRDSPVLRVFHTWIYTGDSNHDTIGNMGWRFPLAGDLHPKGFLSALDDSATWLSGYYLRQHDHDEYTLFAYDEPKHDSRSTGLTIPARPLKEISNGKNAPGIMAATNNAFTVHVGIQDFWRNFPSSLMSEDDALTFYQWPRYGHPRRHPINTSDISDVWRLWFAHEGETLNFRLPVELTEAPIFVTESGPESHFAYGRPDSVNAQGIAKTAEMWIYLQSTAESSPTAVEVEGLRSLSEDSLLAVVDPQWMVDSGAFYEAGAANLERHPRYEAGYTESVLNPMRQVERLGIYGKWIYGDLLLPANLDTREATLYRTFRKAHWGWPYSWLQFARSGAFAPRRFAMAATRMMTDIAFCHYVSPDLKEFFAEKLEPRQMWVELQPFRARGWNNRNLIPWAGYWGPTTRCYCDEADYLWDAWHIAGYHRARDIALVWAAETKIEEADKIMRGPLTAGYNRGRWPANQQKQYLEMYENTWDPWFLAAAQAIADMVLWRHRTEENYLGHFWNAGHVTWQRYSGDPEHEEFLLEHIKRETDQHYYGWGSAYTPTIPATVFGYLLTGDLYYLRKAAGLADLLLWAHYNGDEFEHYRGFYLPGALHTDLLYTSWQQIWHPWLIGIFDRAGQVPHNPILPAFEQTLSKDDHILVVKKADQPLELRTQQSHKITGPGGNVFSEGDSKNVTLPANAPAGVYDIVVNGKIKLPISPVDTPEVFQPANSYVKSGSQLMQYWFKVPEGTDSFWIEFENKPLYRQHIRQTIIWTPDGDQAWAHRLRAVDHDPSTKTIRAEIQVNPQLAGKLWRVTLPATYSTVPFKLSPNIPALLAHDATRWFDPEN